MQLSPLGRRLVFGLIVCVLAGLGVYLLRPAAFGVGRPAAQHGAQPTATRSPRPTVSAAAGQADIYQWLPFTQTGLTTAAVVAAKFGAAYGSYSYTQDAASYVGPLVPITAPQLVGQIEAAYSAPGVASVRVSGKQVATATATIASIRTFGPSSLTFLVQVVQQVTGTAGSSEQSTVYAVTLTGSGTSWQVTDVELQSAGNS
jgi:hypothetical protein